MVLAPALQTPARFVIRPPLGLFIYSPRSGLKEKEMALSAQVAFDTITKFIDENGGNYQRWYTGIASDPKRMLFKEHNVPQSDKWVYSPCANEADSRNVEAALLELGCDGIPHNGDQKGTWVYAFLKSGQTKPKL